MDPVKKTGRFEAALQSLGELLETVHRLRAPGGCPWDREQTFQSLRPFLIEEAYEVLDVLDRIRGEAELKDERNQSEFKEELGDLLLQILLHAEIASESKTFHIGDVAETLNSKLVSRHPHVFGDQKVDGAEAAYQNWEKQKAKERKKKDAKKSVLDGLPTHLPALQKASRTIEKVTRVGFQWKDLDGPLEKLDEEIEELKAAIRSGERGKIQHELGDALFCLSNLAYLLKVEPEEALRENLRRFGKRFRYVEESLSQMGKTPEDSTLEEMDRFWDEAKRREN